MTRPRPLRNRPLRLPRLPTTATSSTTLSPAPRQDLGRDDDSGLWRLADRVARLRDADPGSVDLLADLLEVLVRRAERDARSRRRGRGGSASRAAGLADLGDA